MDRSFLRYGYTLAVFALAAAMLSTACGCRSALATAAYLVKGTNVDAEFDGLEQKKVAVVCRPLASMTFSNANVAKDLAREVSLLLKNNVPKIEMIDQQKVNQWLDENGGWADYSEFGGEDRLGADVLVGIDLQGFSIYQSQVLYQGKANVKLTVYDCANDNEIVFEKELPQSVYPPNAVISTSEKQERQFRREYLRILADQIGRCFYAHDRHADYALDVNALD